MFEIHEELLELDVIILHIDEDFLPLWSWCLSSTQSVTVADAIRCKKDIFVEVHFGHTMKLHSQISVLWKVTNLIYSTHAQPSSSGSV